MTPAEWLASNNPTEMLHALNYLPRPDRCAVPGVGGLWWTDRKLYLLALACSRAEIVGRLGGADALEAFERAADAEHPRPALLEARERFPGHAPFHWPAFNLAKSMAHAAGRRGCIVVREIFGNPFRPVAFSPEWRTDSVRSLAAWVYDVRDFSAMPILADALQDAGCNSDDVLDHCRGPGPHVRGCWVLDLILGKE